MKRLVFLPVALLFGCFAPDLSGAMLLCDSSHFCPDGYSCVNGQCQIGTGGNPGGTDGGTGGGTDGGSSGPSGCADGMGSDVTSSGKAAWACPGTYQASSDPTKNADRLCSSGFGICTVADSVNQNTCNNLGGFFLANVAVKWTNGSSSCGPSAGQGNQTAGFAGCGKNVSQWYVSGISACSGFLKAMSDSSNFTLQIGSPYNPLTTTTSSNAASNGVLCCKK